MQMFTVKELIDELSKLPQDIGVIVASQGYYYILSKDCISVEKPPEGEAEVVFDMDLVDAETAA